MNMKATSIDHDVAQTQISPRRTPDLTLIEGPSRPSFREQLIGRSPALLEVIRRIELVARTDSAVLIHGETGTGKELIARAIHQESARRDRPFVALNVAAIPTQLLESEVFGHEKGAFTGAVARRVGRFEEAHDGTIFLDEIGELHPELQPKLLRLLQEHELQRLGGSKTLACNARLIAATNRDLRELVQSKQFRADLFCRLNVFPIHSPPLRERFDDIPSLVGHFTAQLARKLDRPPLAVSAATLHALEHHPWSGNIRELQNVLERAMIVSTGAELEVELDERRPAVSGVGLRGASDLSTVMRAHILRVLADCQWVIAGSDGAAARLGLKRTTLNARMRKLGIVRPVRSRFMAGLDEEMLG